MGFLTLANTRELKEQNRELQRKLDLLLNRVSKLESDIESLKGSQGRNAGELQGPAARSAGTLG